MVKRPVKLSIIIDWHDQLGVQQSRKELHISGPTMIFPVLSGSFQGSEYFSRGILAMYQSFDMSQV